jgi:predicted transcriptional regulator
MADLTVTATSVVNVSAPTASGLAGETITAGQAVYLKSTDGKLWKAQCDGTAEEGTPIGIALNGASVGQPVTYAANGSIVIGATTVKTTTYMLSATPGGVAPQADLISTNKIVRLGHATDTAGAMIVDIKATGAVV